ncbi:MAG: V-type ATP synthase subunit F [Lentisphaeria bacterium]|nr:V-type ATP synthase subunit F [Lentisphaeria bacterium]
MAFHIIGDQDTVLGYRFAGVTGSVAETPAEAREAFRGATGEGRCRILLLTERVEAMLEGEVADHRLAAVPPYLVVVQDLQGPVKGRKTLEALIFEAVGIRIGREDEKSSTP